MSSQFKRYCIGIVVKDKKRNDDLVEIYPVETLPLVDGKIGEVSELKSNLSDSFGKRVGATITKEHTIIAKWHGLDNSNRATPPDVIANESVQVWRHGDSDQYYWSDFGYEPSIRRHETVRYTFANNTKYEEEIGPENSYWLEVSTHDKYVKFHLSDNDGEKTTYDLEFNTAEGYFILKDGRGNEIELDSAKDFLTTNILDTVKTISKNVIVDNAKDIDITNGTNINIKNGGNVVIDNANDITLTNGGDIKVNNTGKVDIDLDKLALRNSGGEIMQILSDLIDACDANKLIGNYGVLTSAAITSAGDFAALKAKVAAFII